MNKIPCMYNNRQFKEIEKFVEDNFGSRCDNIFHEIVSEYVHTDTFVVKTNTGEKEFITCGMGSREMNTPNYFTRCELVMSVSQNFDSNKEKSAILAGELVKISKFPFREETWLGTGHTMNASEKFIEAFGYDYFAFIKLPLSAKLTGIEDQINFLMLVPIYEEEREWCVRNHTLAFLDKLHEKYKGKELNADFKREKFIPDDLDEDELDNYNMMTALGIDKATLQKLCEFIEQQDQNNVEITYELIEDWLAKNK